MKEQDETDGYVGNPKEPPEEQPKALKEQAHIGRIHEADTSHCSGTWPALALPMNGTE